MSASGPSGPLVGMFMESWILLVSCKVYFASDPKYLWFHEHSKNWIHFLFIPPQLNILNMIILFLCTYQVMHLFAAKIFVPFQVRVLQVPSRPMKWYQTISDSIWRINCCKFLTFNQTLHKNSKTSALEYLIKWN